MLKNSSVQISIHFELTIRTLYRERSGSVVECLTRDRGFEPQWRHCVVSFDKTHLLNNYVNKRCQKYFNIYWQSLVQVWINDQVSSSLINPLAFQLVQAVYCVMVERLIDWSIHVQWTIYMLIDPLTGLVSLWKTVFFVQMNTQLLLCISVNKQMVKLGKYFSDFNFRRPRLTPNTGKTGWRENFPFYGIYTLIYGGLEFMCQYTWSKYNICYS